MTCQPTQCDVGTCPAVPVLSGEVVNGDGNDFLRLPGVEVVARLLPDGSEVVTTSSAAGVYYFLVPPDSLIEVRSQRPGWISELHRTRVPATGWDLPVDLRHAEFFDNVLRPQAATQNRALGMLVIEFLGPARSVEGVGAKLEGRSASSVVFGPTSEAAIGDRIPAGGKQLQFFPNLVPGNVRLTFLESPSGVRCVAQSGENEWPVAPGILTQVDAECR